MLNLPDYRIREKISENRRVKVYRGYTSKENIPVVIKILQKEEVNPIGISKLMHEYEISRNLDIEGVIKPIKLEQTDMSYMIVMEDVGAISLRQYIDTNKFTLLESLKIIIRLTEVLLKLHNKDIIHRDLKPDNILINPSTGQTYIIDFSCAMFFNYENKNANIAKSHVGSLEYMPPEQTGRLCISVDQRSDLYALGVVFYEMITGRLPLNADNLAEWLHAHITQIPLPPYEINISIPHIVSDIIMKLLAKNPEERYQSAYGLLWDLKKCRRLLEKNEKENISFSLGQGDILSTFRLPKKLYGRENEKKEIESAFELVCKGNT
jgi:histidine kinase